MYSYYTSDDAAPLPLFAMSEGVHALILGSLQLSLARNTVNGITIMHINTLLCSLCIVG